MKFFIKKLITLIITLLVISFLTFTAFSVIPGDAALSRLGKDATEEQLERARDEMGLNDPLLERYGRWVTDAMQGDFGESYRYEGTSVRSLLAQRLPVTVLLAVISLLIITVISVPLGILSARFAGKWVDTLTNCLTQILMAVPSFFLICSSRVNLSNRRKISESRHSTFYFRRSRWRCRRLRWW